MKEILIQKFGGTSLKDSSMFIRVGQIVSNYLKVGINIVVVVSAPAGFTNKLTEINSIVLIDEEKAVSLLFELYQRALQVANDLELNEAKVPLDTLLNETNSIIKGTTLLGELNNEICSKILSFGERVSSCLLNFYFHKLGIVSLEIYSPNYIIYDSIKYSFKTKELLQQKLNINQVIVAQGYIASTIQGEITTLGRGGSDWSASIFGAELNAKEVQIWTDVEGVYSIDPRIIENPKPISNISFNSIKNAAIFGAKVLHPETLSPLILNSIPVKVLSTFKPNGGFTTIRDNYNEDYFIISVKKEIKSIKFKESEDIINYMVSFSLLSIISKNSNQFYLDSELNFDSNDFIKNINYTEGLAIITILFSENHISKVYHLLSSICAKFNTNGSNENEKLLICEVISDFSNSKVHLIVENREAELICKFAYDILAD
jgi:aspartate kinase